jgi:5-methylcytosine-specific restriction endonuclease McrA
MGYKDRKTQSAYQAGWLSGRRTAWLENNGPCRECGSWERLEVDHIDPKQKVTHRVWSLARDEREAELKKCQVLCNKCHKKKTAEMLAKPLVHGTRNGYTKHGCRCADCREANNSRARAWRERQQQPKGETAA